MRMDLRCRLEELIKRSGLRKDYIAGKLQISTRQLRNYELQVSYIPMDKAYILSELLGCFLDDLYEIKMEKKDPLLEDIEQLEFSQRVYYLLKRQQINTVGELLNYDVKRIPRIGPKTLVEILNKIDEIRNKIGEETS
jgi:DNA-directed RNA polymerase alpha subunit